MFFQNHSRGPFLEDPSADLASTGRFWCHLRFSGFPKKRPLDRLFRRKSSKSRVGRSIRDDLEPTLAQTAIKMVPGRPETRFSLILDRISSDVGPMLLDFWPHFDTP